MDNKRWYKKKWGILFIALFTIALIFLIAFVFLVLNVIKKSNQGQLVPNPTSGGTEISKIITGPGDNFSIGATNPKITIVEFSDFSCPYCKNSFPVIRELSRKYKKNVKIIFRDYPIITEQSGDLAMAGRCAGEQGLFWPMHDKLFINQGVAERKEIINLAMQVGTDVERFTKCFDSKKYLSKIQKDFSDGQELGITGTPTWFINGHKVKGSLPLSAFEEIINKTIKN